MKKLVFTGIVFMMCMGCQTEQPSLIGNWVQPIPGQQGEQGIRIEKDGVASSINMHTLVYKTWKQQDNRLILGGESIGNRVSGAFSDTLVIRKLTKDTLVLSRGSWKDTYTRKK